jgi:hypothetical protein
MPKKFKNELFKLYNLVHVFFKDGDEGDGVLHSTLFFQCNNNSGNILTNDTPENVQTNDTTEKIRNVTNCSAMLTVPRINTHL